MELLVTFLIWLSSPAYLDGVIETCRNARPTIPIPSKWEGHSTRFLKGEKVLVEFRSGGEMRIQWQSVGITCPAATMTSWSRTPTEDGVSLWYLRTGKHLKIKVSNLRLTVVKNGVAQEASALGIELELERVSK
jgi:hypothetical protein